MTLSLGIIFAHKIIISIIVFNKNLLLLYRYRYGILPVLVPQTRVMDLDWIRIQ
jgi:hypothetical protein